MRVAAMARAAQLERDDDGGDSDDGAGADPSAAALPAYTVEATGAFMTAAGAVSKLNSVAGKIPRDQWTEPWTPRYEIREEGAGGGFVCTVTVPLKHREFTGSGRSRAEAKRAAALRAVAELHRTGLLDDRLRPVGAVVSREERGATGGQAEADEGRGGGGSAGGAGRGGGAPSARMCEKAPDALAPGAVEPGPRSRAAFHPSLLTHRLGVCAARNSLCRRSDDACSSLAAQGRGTCTSSLRPHPAPGRSGWRSAFSSARGCRWRPCPRSASTCSRGRGALLRLSVPARMYLQRRFSCPCVLHGIEPCTPHPAPHGRRVDQRVEYDGPLHLDQPGADAARAFASWLETAVPGVGALLGGAAPVLLQPRSSEPAADGAEPKRARRSFSHEAAGGTGGSAAADGGGAPLPSSSSRQPLWEPDWGAMRAMALCGPPGSTAELPPEVSAANQRGGGSPAELSEGDVFVTSHGEGAPELPPCILFPLLAHGRPLQGRSFSCALNVHSAGTGDFVRIPCTVPFPPLHREAGAAVLERAAGSP